MGYKISREGLHATQDKIKAIVDAPEPINIKQLRSFLGVVHYYGKYIPNLASLLALNELSFKEKHKVGVVI